MKAIFQNRVYLLNEDDTMTLIGDDDHLPRNIPVPYGNEGLDIDPTDDALRAVGYFVSDQPTTKSQMPKFITLHSCGKVTVRYFFRPDHIQGVLSSAEPGSPGAPDHACGGAFLVLNGLGSPVHVMEDALTVMAKIERCERGEPDPIPEPQPAKVRKSRRAQS